MSDVLSGLIDGSIYALIAWGIWTHTPYAKRRRREKLEREFGRRDGRA